MTASSATTSARAKPSPLPASCLPRGLNREQAAAYVGIGVTKFDELIGKGMMPPPKRIDGRRVWDIRKLDAAFDNLPDEGAANPWD